MSIDENREARGLEPAQLPQDIADLAKVPVRLLQYVKAASEPPPQQAQEPPQPADMMGSQAPANMVDEQAGKSIAVDAELKRWRKVAVKEFNAGRNPADRVFDSVVIDADHKASILAALVVAGNESEVKAAFESAPFRHSDWQNYP
jgi:hypothetical protein